MGGVQVVRDGEGAEKLIRIDVTGAESDQAAKRVALSIANSPLVKTAIAGSDANWGRIVMAVGKSGEAADRDKLKISFGKQVVAENGEINPETYPAWATITFQFPARGDMPPVKFVWYEGKKAPDSPQNLPPMGLFQGEKPVSSGSLLVGEKGTLYSPDDYGAAYKLLPKKEFAGYKRPERTLPRITDRLERTRASRRLSAAMRSRASRRSVSIWVSPGPRVPIPPPSRSRCDHRPRIRARLYSSCASSTWSFPSAVWAWEAKMSRMIAVRSMTGIPSSPSRLRSWRGDSSSSQATMLAWAWAISRLSSSIFPGPR